FTGADVLFHGEAPGNGYVVSFGARDILLVKEGRVASCAAEAGEVLNYSGEVPGDQPEMPGRAVETLAVSFPTGVLAHLEYQGEVVFPDDVRRERLVIELRPCTSASCAGMIVPQVLEQTRYSSRLNRENRRESRAKFMSTLMAFVVCALIVCAIGSCTMLMMR
ncbi:MAG TPA: hypothetical protein PLP17_00860, partial [Oligoflexia bacterium]|nr:hypothetical protein [Oligoflexia bacterium]